MVDHRRDNDRSARDDTAQQSAYHTEHWLAWLFSAGAIVLGVLGILRAFGAYGAANTVGGQVTSISPGGLPDTYWDGGLLLLASIAAALLAFALHRTDHHRMRDLDAVPDSEEGLWKLEHALAYVMAIATVVFAVIGLLTGYNKIGGHHWQPDGVPWLLCAVGLGVLTNVLHSVRHHQMLPEEHIVRRPVVAETERVTERPTVAPGTGYVPDSPRPLEDIPAEQQTPRMRDRR
jgi:hypothetical protein